MRTSDSDFLRHQLSEAVWAQWTTLGVLGATPMRESRCIDPEALVWLTFARDVADARLIDAARDWLALNKHLVSVHRLRNIFGDDRTSLEPVMAALRGNPDRPKPRFKTAAKAQAPDPMVPANLAMRLRLLMDAGVRSEVVRYLITRRGHGEDAQAVADAAMFAKRNVNDTLLSLVRARVVAESWAGNRRVFSLDQERWCAFIDLELASIPGYMPWIKLFVASTAILEWLEADERATETRYLRASGARSLVTGIQPNLTASGVDGPVPGPLAEAFLVPFDALVARVADTVVPQIDVEAHAV